ncbi:hypothetical protein DFLDMN_001681 [Cupriavidus sp. H19C3]
MEIVDDIDRIARLERIGLAHQLAVPCHTGLDALAVRGVKPDDAATPAEAGDADAIEIAAVLARPREGGVEIAHHLRVRHLLDDVGLQLLDGAKAAGIALARKQLGRDGEIAGLGEATAHIGDMLVHTEDLADDENHGQLLLALRLRTVDRHAEPRRGHRDLARGQTLEVGLDGLRGHRQHGRGKRRPQRGLDEATAIERLAGDETFHFGFEHAHLLSIRYVYG